MVMLNREYITSTCSDWLRNCGKEIVTNINARYLIDVISNGKELASAEKFIRETMNSKQVLQGSLEWLKSVFGSEIELPWKRIRELVLGDDSNLWDDIFEYAFPQRMKSIIDSGFEEWSRTVNVVESVHVIAETSADGKVDFRDYLDRVSNFGRVWFMEPNARKVPSFAGSKAQQSEESDIRSCLNAYFGTEVSRIRDAVDSRCQNVLDDLLSFLESRKAFVRLKDLAPYVQSKCFERMSTMTSELKSELDKLSSSLKNDESTEYLPAASGC